jgi:glycosyltransferase involved in cell wall biosynthesis
MATPRFSVVIPTRQRANTLRHTLQTCLAQDYDDYEIVVCDNFSSPETRQVVDDCASERIVYLRTSRPLAMSVNWELAVEQARGEYVTVLGDDDGLMPYAFPALDDLLGRHEVRAIRWDRGMYSWPCYPIREDANVLRFPTVRDLGWCDGREQIRRVAHFKAGFDTLPMIYNSVIRRDLIDELRSKVGRVFPSTSPDVYTGFAFAYLDEAFLSVTVPFNVAGLSGHSNGVANQVLNGKSSVADDFYRLNDTDKIRIHPWVPDLTSNAVAIADSFLSAKRALFPDDRRLVMDRRQMIEEILRSEVGTTPVERRLAREKVRNTLDDDATLQAWLDAQPDPAPATRWTPQPTAYGNDGFMLNVRADRWGITNIAEAVSFMAKVLCLGEGPIQYNLPSVHPSPTRFRRTPRRSTSERLARELRRLVRQGSRICGWTPRRAS